MDIIGEYEDEFNELTKSLKKGLKEYKATEDESERDELGNKISSDLNSLVDTYDQMKREFRSLDPKSKGQWKSKLTEYEEQMKNLKTRCNRIVNTASKNQLYGKRGGKNADRQRLADSNADLTQGNEILKDALRTAQEAEEMGLGTISEIDNQNKKLINSKNNAIRVKDNADTARSILTRMYKRNIYMKLVIWFMILALLAGLICFIYFVFIK